jgi:hypothetical protein
MMRNSEAKNIPDSLGNYYASNRATAIINYNKYNKNISQDREIGRVFAEYKDKLVVIDGEDKKEHAYLIPKSKVNLYGDNEVYFNISITLLKEFEI